MSKQDFQAIWDAAQKAATDAQDRFLLAHGEVFFCGFAWVNIRPARGAFVTWCRKQNTSAVRGMPFGSLGYYGGWQIGHLGAYNGQSLAVKEAGARAFADYLKTQGISASVETRDD